MNKKLFLPLFLGIFVFSSCVRSEKELHASYPGLYPNLICRVWRQDGSFALHFWKESIPPGKKFYCAKEKDVIVIFIVSPMDEEFMYRKECEKVNDISETRVGILIPFKVSGSTKFKILYKRDDSWFKNSWYVVPKATQNSVNYPRPTW
jgi:hypothetical protein